MKRKSYPVGSSRYGYRKINGKRRKVKITKLPGGKESVTLPSNVPKYSYDEYQKRRRVITDDHTKQVHALQDKYGTEYDDEEEAYEYEFADGYWADREPQQAKIVSRLDALGPEPRKNPSDNGKEVTLQSQKATDTEAGIGSDFGANLSVSVRHKYGAYAKRKTAKDKYAHINYR